MFGLFKKQKSELKRAVIFVDYEHWYISFDKFYDKKPDIKAFREELSKSYDIVDKFQEYVKSPARLLKRRTHRLISKKILLILSC